MLPGFSVTSAHDVQATTLNGGLITVKTIKEATPQDPSVIQEYFMAPGADAGEDPHHEVEILYILEGDFHDGEQVWPAGSVISGQPGSVHYPSSASGCRFLAVFPNGMGEAA
ncbi:cupin domain-containing protein (plasmid) [Streptomyces sp. NBC_00445]|uniref:cupin domain-containing protein n=1 Tax=Streptomyces sp. NBC_00445 TaxID=2975745 RepID=UPI002E1C1D12